MTERVAGLVEHDDRWILPFRDLVVTQIQVDHSLRLILDDDQGAVYINSLATLGWVNVKETPQTEELDPGRQTICPALALFNKAILSAVAFKSGTLRLVFDDGHQLTVNADPAYEAWQATGPNHMLVVSIPGGDLAVWPSPIP